MKNLKRILCLTLALLMLLTSLIACANSEEEDTGHGELSISEDGPVETDQYGQEVYSDPTAGLSFGGKHAPCLCCDHSFHDALLNLKTNLEP